MVPRRVAVRRRARAVRNAAGRAIAACVLATTVAITGARAADEAADIAAITAKTGRPPLYCASLPGDRRVCTWHERKTQHLVCEFDASSVRTAKPCLQSPANESMRTYTKSDRKGARQPRTGIAAEEKQAARLAFAGARDLDDIIALVGAGPVWCLGGETLECGWFATRRTPGYVTVARFAGVAGRKVALTCAFGPDANLLADSCTAKAARSTRPPRP